MSSNEVVNDRTSSDTPPPPKKYYIEGFGGQVSLKGPKVQEQLQKFGKGKRMDSMIDVLMSWPNQDIWPFKLAVPTIFLCAGMPGFVLNKAFRNGLYLSRIGIISSTFATVGIPAVLSGFVHAAFITTDILEQNTACPVCVQVRSADLQLTTAVLYPAILTPIVNFHLASGLKDIYLPKINTDPKGVLRYAVELFGTAKPRFLGAAALQVVVAMGVTHLEQNCFNNVVLPIMNGENNFSKETRKVEFFKD